MSAWFACDEPERPTDGSVRWHYAFEGPCVGCQVKASALAQMYPDDPHVVWLVGMVALVGRDA